MELTLDGRHRLQRIVREDLVEVLGEAAKEITTEVRDYVAKTLYTRPKSLYYERDGDNGGFLETFADSTYYASLIDSMTRVQGNKMYITFVLRDYENINYEGREKGRFGHHVFFDGEETNNTRFSSDLDKMIDEGWNIYARSGVVIKHIQGIHFKEYAKKIVKLYSQKIINQKLASRGYDLSGSVGVGRKRLSIPLEELSVEIDEEV